MKDGKPFLLIVDLLVSEIEMAEGTTKLCFYVSAFNEDAGLCFTIGLTSSWLVYGLNLAWRLWSISYALLKNSTFYSSFYYIISILSSSSVTGSAC